MKFIIIDATKKEIRSQDHEELVDARRTVGLGDVDHGTLFKGLAYVVDEFGLFKPAAEQHYWSIGGRLIAGNSVLYAYNEMGETMDAVLTEHLVDQITFFDDAAEVEAAIVAGRVNRPEMAFNVVVTWGWPDPAPKGFGF